MKISYNMVKHLNFIEQHPMTITFGYLIENKYAEWIIESSMFFYKKLIRIEKNYPNQPLKDFIIDCKLLEKNYDKRTYNGLKEVLDKLLDKF